MRARRQRHDSLTREKNVFISHPTMRTLSFRSPWQIPLALALLVLSFQLHIGWETIKAPKPKNMQEALPSLGVLKAVSLGYDSLIADYYWLRSLSYFGAIESHAAKYIDLPALLERVVGLDPYFTTAYEFAGTALTVENVDPTESIRLLEQGTQYRPEVWTLGFYLGFNRYYFLHDFAHAATDLARTSLLPDAPEWLAPLAARVASHAGEPEVGLDLVRSLMRQVEDETMLETFRERQEQLEMEVMLKHLNGLARAYAEKFQTLPTDLSQLVTAGLIAQIPRSPTGADFYVEEGEVRTTGERLRIPDLILEDREKVLRSGNR